MHLTSSGGGGPETSPSSSGDPETSLSSSGGPETSPSSSRDFEMHLASSGDGRPETSPPSNAASEVLPTPSVGGVPETSPLANEDSGLSLLSSAGAGMPSSSSATHGATSLLSGLFGASSSSLPVAPLEDEQRWLIEQRWLDGLPTEVLRMVLNLVPDDELSSLVDANRRLHSMTTSILLERKHFSARGRRVLIVHQDVAFTALGLYVR